MAAEVFDVRSDDTFSGITKELATNTCMHGLPNVVRARHIIRKVIWALLTMGGLSVMIWQIEGLIVTYYEYPTNTDITLKYDSAVEFPMVTICNMNPIRKSAVYYLDTEFQQILGFEGGQLARSTWMDVSQWVEDATTNATNATNGTTLMADAGPPTVSVMNWTEKEEGNFYDQRNTDYQTKMDYLFEVSKLNDSLKKEVGHNISWMLLSCQFEGYHCGPNNFTYFYNTAFGSCYSFNTGKTHSVLTASKPGPLYGLSLELYIEQEEYMGETASEAGVKVVVGNQSTMPHPEDEGYSVAPGTATSISLTMIDIRRAVSPWGLCQNVSHEDNLRNNSYAGTKGLNIGYSDRACYKTCYQLNVIKSCGCCDFTLPCGGHAITFQEENEEPVRVCNTTGEDADVCLKDVTSRYQTRELDCAEKCPPSCEETSYSATVTNAAWPSDAKMESVAETLMAKDEEMNWKIQTLSGKSGGDAKLKTFIKENVLKVEVFFQKLNYQRIETYASYGETKLLADIGGQVGLWIGLSVITLFELVEYFVNLIVLFLLKLRHPTATRTSPQPVAMADRKPKTSSEENIPGPYNYPYK